MIFPPRIRSPGAGERHVEDLRALLVYDRSSELVQDPMLTIVDAAPVFETTTHITTIDPDEEHA